MNNAVKFLLPSFVVLLCIGVMSARPLMAEDALTWQDCVKEARAHNPDLVAAHARVTQAVAGKGVTRSSALPQLNGNFSTDRAKTEGRDSSKSYAYGVTGRQLLFDGFKTSNDLAEAQENIKSAQYDYLVVSSNVRLSLWTAYVDLLSAQEFLGVTENILDRRRQNLELVRLQYQSGMQHKGSLLTAEANEAQAELDHVQARRNVVLMQRSLSKVLGRDRFTPLTVVGDLSVGDVDRTEPDLEMLVDSTPLLKELVAKKEAARYGLKSARSGFFPQIFADAGVNRTGDRWMPGTDNWSAGLTVSFPLFQGGERQASLEKAKAAYDQVEADTRSGRDTVIFTLARAWTAWQNNVEQSVVQQKFLLASRQRADIVEAQYKSGLATFNDWTTIEDNLVRDQKALLQAKAGALIAEANWLQAKGVTLDE